MAVYNCYIDYGGRWVGVRQGERDLAGQGGGAGGRARGGRGQARRLHRAGQSDPCLSDKCQRDHCLSDKCQSGHCQCGSASSDKCQFDLVSSLTWSVVCRAPPHQHRADSRRGALGQTRQGVCTSTERCAHQPQSFEADGTEARDTVKSRHVLFTNFTTPNRPASRQTVDHTHTSTERLTQCWLPAV